MMFLNKFQGLRIVSSYPGPGTCETIYVAEDGSHWRQDDSDHSQETVPPRLGQIAYGMILPR